MSEILATPPIASTESTVRASHTGWFLFAFYLLAVLWGVRHVYSDQESQLDLLFPFAMAIVLASWALADARRRGRPISMFVRPWFLLLAGVVVPGYVIRSRGWRGLGWIILHVFLWYTLATVSLLIGGLIIYGEAWLHALGF